MIVGTTTKMIMSTESPDAGHIRQQLDEQIAFIDEAISNVRQDHLQDLSRFDAAIKDICD